MRKIIFYLLVVFSAVLTVSASNSNSLSFDGTSGYVNCGRNSALRPVLAITVEAWVNPDVNTTWNGVVTNLQDNYNNESGYGLFMDNSNNKIAWWVQTIGGIPNNMDVPSYTLPMHTWTHVVGTYDGATLKLYINGSMVSSRPRTGTINWNYQPIAFAIGQYLDDDEHHYFKGKIDDVRVWAYARSAQEIANDMHSELIGNESGLMAYFKLNEGLGTIIADNSVNAYNSGTIYGGATWSADNPDIIYSALPKNKALRFDGTTGYVNCGTSSSLRPTNAITIEAWIKSNIVSNSSYGLGIITNIQDNGLSESGYGLFSYYGDVMWWLQTVGGERTPSNVNAAYPHHTLPFNVWTHVAGTYDGQNLRLYINGSQVANMPKAGAIDWTYLPLALTIGKYYDDNESSFFKGDVDEVRIWNVARTAQEINSTKDVELSGRENGLVAYYNCNSGKYATLSDNSNLALSSGSMVAYSDWVDGAPVLQLSTPTNQASNVSISKLAATSATIKCTKGNGNNRLILLKQGSTGAFTPTDSATYSANSTFDSLGASYSGGWQCVYNGVDDSIAVSGLNPLTTYRVQIIEYNGVKGIEQYQTATEINNPANFDTPCLAPATPTITMVGNTLHSSASTGNQWYNSNGIINGETGQDLVFQSQNTYYTIVTLSDCSSAPSNSINTLVTSAKNGLINDNIISLKCKNNQVTINLASNCQSANYELTNLSGQSISKGWLEGKSTLSLHDYPKGIYLIKVTTGISTAVKRLLVQ
ncbi:MAG: LamG-like jellyroll fold domain-containing protein [Bacteroidales bacterium]